ncbi:MAG TPA: PGPGW domain-containing protein [Methylomirabilota bacterium]|nr:PGPGW domain-containing protein [Methylomirabilota bacterium]
MRSRLIGTLKQARRLVVAFLGLTVLLIGLVMIVLPGPAVLVIPIGLAILATEFVWARRLLGRMRTEAERLKSWRRGRTEG